MSLVDTATGEIVGRSAALVVPRPHEVTSAYELCEAIERALPLVDDPAELAEAKARLLAIETYMAQHTKHGRARLEASLRRIEIRMGEVLGEARRDHDRTGGAKSLAGNLDALTKKERHELRLLAAHADVAEQVIADSDDTAPPSRRKVLDAIRDHLAQQKEDEPVGTPAGADRAEQVRALAALGLTPTQIAADLGIGTARIFEIARLNDIPLIGEGGRPNAAMVAQRIEAATELASQGYSSQQIASKLDVTTEAFRAFCKQNGVEVPADAVVKRTRNLNSERIVRSTIEQIDGIGILLDHVDYNALVPEEISGWLPILDNSIKSLQTLRSNLRKAVQP